MFYKYEMFKELQFLNDFSMYTKKWHTVVMIILKLLMFLFFTVINSGYIRLHLYFLRRQNKLDI